jgi:hypothetical protein
MASLDANHRWLHNRESVSVCACTVCSGIRRTDHLQAECGLFLTGKNYTLFYDKSSACIRL